MSTSSATSTIPLHLLPADLVLYWYAIGVGILFFVIARMLRLFR